jgi:hypothetical protein
LGVALYGKKEEEILKKMLDSLTLKKSTVILGFSSRKPWRFKASNQGLDHV